MASIDICSKQELTTILERFKPQRDNLLPILNEINKKFGYISPVAMMEIAEYLDIPVAEIHGVISFYHFLSTEKKGKYIIRLCKTISCEMAGKEKIARMLEKELGIKFGETTSDGMFSLEYTNCIGMCDHGPAMLVNEKVYAKLTPEKVIEIVDELKKRGQL
ncbi:[Fe] hydrogenase small subunit [Thermotomaculum hydrothermale]|uniref:[Fe] hydrogenase small subunit n=1 Tax=Thermotomaculum hydrothermale TaxID=981385 RepID=A0A7R6PSZ1_9BACT|nr:NADH-quinone oxidoreductase subunit NuoE [Thermotomaculum hydrothermale]BBB32052.1 [Fe] hydrogenase small subunit [Thermotomaculum hydrothermale]